MKIKQFIIQACIFVPIGYISITLYDNYKNDKKEEQISQNYNETFKQSMTFVKAREGYSEKAYKGIDGAYYICYGNLLSEFNKLNSELSYSEICDNLLANEIFKDLKEIEVHFPDLQPNQKTSIISLVYSIKGRFNSIIGTELYKAIHNLDYSKIAEHWDFLGVNGKSNYRMQGRRMEELKNFIKHLPESEQKELLLIQKNSFGLALNVNN